jgi:hypothetical protein
MTTFRSCAYCYGAGIESKGCANTAFGTYTQIIWSEDGEPIPETRGEKGLVITQILSAEPPQ